MIKKTFALTLSLSVSAQLAAQTETDYLSAFQHSSPPKPKPIIFPT